MANFVARPIEELEKLPIEELEKYVEQEKAARSERGLTPPTTVEDIKYGAPRWAAQGGVALHSTLPTAADLGMAGVQQGAEALGATGIAEKVGGARKAIEPLTYSGEMAELQKQYPKANLGYGANTPGGGYGQNIITAAPAVAAAALTGGESLAPAIGKGISSSVLSEGARQNLPEWTQPYGQMIAALGGWGGPAAARRFITPFPASAERNAMANILTGKGLPVSAGERSGSRVAATIEGAQSSRGKIAGDTALKMAGIERKPGDPAPTSKLISNRLKEIGNRYDQLEQTPISLNPQLGADLKDKASSHTSQLQGTSLSSPEVGEALNDYNALSLSGQLTGMQYRRLREKWHNSDVPEVNQMADILDKHVSMQPGVGPAWAEANRDYAYAKAVEASSKAAGGKATTGALPIDPIVKKLKSETPLKDFGEAVQGIYGNAPEPYSGAAGVLGAGVLGTAGALAGALHPGGGAEHGLYGMFLAPSIGATVGGAARLGSKAAQPYLRNQAILPPVSGQGYTTLDPKTGMMVQALTRPGLQQTPDQQQ